MSFSGRTPESLLPRSDSKNPATTCKGITTNGRPCRRALAASPRSSPLASPSSDHGVLAMLDEDNAAAYYCWQHKDQAESLAARPEQKTTLYPLKERSSIDTLVDRVGVLNLDEEIQRPKKARHRRRRSDEQHLTRRDTLPSGWTGMQGPLMTVPEDVKQTQLPKRKEYTHGRSNVKASWTCCIRADDDEPRPPRPRPHRDNGDPNSSYASPKPMTVPGAHHEVRRKPVASANPEMLQRPAPATTNNSNSQTQTLLSLIPTTLSPQTTSALLAELSRPISPHDEAGYIYIFWLTPDSEASKPDDETASSLLDSDDEDYTASPTRQRRTSHALQRYSSVRKPTQPRTILLKIGRAANVHRRLSQWTRQCGQNITLVRYYPYSASQNQVQNQNEGLSSTSARRVPHVHRVERLIHLELSEKRAQKDVCEQCGREHREWFEVEASKKGLRAVDELIRRWVAWAERADRDGSGRIDDGRGLPNEHSSARGRTDASPGVVDGYY